MNHYDELVTIDANTRFVIRFGLGPLGKFEYLSNPVTDPDTSINDPNSFIKMHRAIDFCAAGLDRAKMISQSIDDFKIALPETPDFDFEHAILAVMRRKARALRTSVPWESAA